MSTAPGSRRPSASLRLASAEEAPVARAALSPGGAASRAPAPPPATGIPPAAGRVHPWRVLVLPGAMAAGRAKQLQAAVAVGVATVEPASPGAEIDLIVVEATAVGLPDLSAVPGWPGRRALPILVVKQPPAGPYRRILIGADLTAGSRATLPAALALSSGARCEVVHVVPVSVPAHRLPTTGAPRAAWRECRRRALDEARRQLAASLPPVPEVTAAVAPGTPEHLLPELARRFAFDLVVVGTGRGRRLGRTMHGSVTASLLRGAPCDALIVPPVVHLAAGDDG